MYRYLARLLTFLVVEIPIYLILLGDSLANSKEIFERVPPLLFNTVLLFLISTPLLLDPEL